MLNCGHFCTSRDIFCEKMKILKKIKNIKSSFRLWFCVENLARNWSKFEISCKFEKIWKTSWCVNETFSVKKWKFWKTVKTIKNRFNCDYTLKILLETGLNLNFHVNLKKYEKLHNVSICTSWNIFWWKNEIFEKRLKILKIVPIVILRWKSCSKLP